jgi:N-acetylglutamate synthase-like GNAT family acetyltransferase
MIIERRKLSLNELKIVSEEIKNTPNINKYLSKTMVDISNNFVASMDQKFLGLVTYIESTDWIEIEVFLVLKEYREKGYGKELFKNSISNLKALKKPIYTITRNPAVMYLLKILNFEEIKIFSFPFSLLIHQIAMVLSLSWIKEFIRKTIKFKSNEPYRFFKYSFKD